MAFLILFGVLLSFGYLIINVIVIVSIINNQDIDNNNKIFWIIMVLVLNVLGLIVYLLVSDKNVLK